VTGGCETWWFDGRKKDAHTTRVRFSNARVKPDLLIENITYPLVEGRTKTHCTGVEKSWSRMERWRIAIPLTIQQPNLVSDRQVPVLCRPFRKDEVCYGAERTARKIANTIRLSTGAARQAIPPDIPHDFFPCQPYLIFHGRINRRSEKKS